MKQAKTLIMFVLAMLISSPALAADTWAVKAEYIEACSCSLFCSCYFNTAPEGHHHCEFNNAIKISKGHVGKVKVDGAKFWMSGDLGGDFTKAMKGTVITFDPSVKPEQQEAIKYLVTKIYPVKWEKMEFDTAPITWEIKGDSGYAKLGDAAEVTLTGFKDAKGKQSVIQNLPYWGAQKNTGFRLAKSTHFYKGHGYDYKHQDRNGFMIAIESSGTVEKEAAN
jgi:hypothetical protein